VEVNPDIKSLGLAEPQEKELTGRLKKVKGEFETSSIKKELNDSRSTTAATPRANIVSALMGCEKWQEKREVLSHIQSVSPDILPDLIRMFKSESNVPLVIEYAQLFSRISYNRQIFCACIWKLREKIPAIQRVIGGIVKDMIEQDLLDQRLISTELRETAGISRKEILSLLNNTNHVLLENRISLLDHVICPGFDASESSVRELAILLTKQMIADASIGGSGVDQMMGVIFRHIQGLSAPRQRVLEAALGMKIPPKTQSGESMTRRSPSARRSGLRQQTPRTGLGRPQTAPPTTTPVSSSFVKSILSALMNGDSLVGPCTDAKVRIDSGSLGPTDRFVETVVKCVKPVLMAVEDTDSREAVLVLVESMTRNRSLWDSVHEREMKVFFKELLEILADQRTRQEQPQMWDELNMAIVHVIANAPKTKVLSVLLELLHISGPVQGLVVKCFEKLHKATRQYIELASGDLAQAALWSMLNCYDDQIQLHGKSLLDRQVFVNALNAFLADSDPLDIGMYIAANIPDEKRKLVWIKHAKRYYKIIQEDAEQ